jgi:hypothetical protein
MAQELMNSANLAITYGAANLSARSRNRADKCLRMGLS